MNKETKQVQRFFWGIFLLILFIFSDHYVLAQSSIDNENKVKTALLAENWTTVADLLNNVNYETPSPVARLLKAHACLAINRNNESLQLFLSVATEEEWQDWKTWTATLAGQQLESHGKVVALYLQGDALTRLGEFDDASNVFDKALQLHKNHPLVLNARGGLYVVNGRVNDDEEQLWNALDDFETLTNQDTSLADAYASHGATLVQLNLDPQEALVLFEKALDLSPNFALALNGRACAGFALGYDYWDTVIEDLQRASTMIEWLSIPAVNMVQFALMKEELMIPVGDEQTAIKPGMAIQATTRYVDSLSTQKAKLERAKAEHNIQQNQNFQKVGTFLANFSYSGGKGGYGMSDEEQESLIERLKREREQLGEGGYWGTRRYKYIDNIIENYEKWKEKGKPKPPEEGKPEEDKPEEDKSKDKPENESTKSSQFLGFIVLCMWKDGQCIPTGTIGIPWWKRQKNSILNNEDFMEFNPQEFVQKAQEEENFWIDYDKFVVSRHPELNKPGGVIPGALVHSYLDTGEWLSTGYGLNYLGQ